LIVGQNTVSDKILHNGESMMRNVLFLQKISEKINNTNME